MKTINIALLGFGVVGQGTYRALNDNAKLIEERCNLKVNVKRILELNRSRYGNLGTDAGCFTADFNDILKDDEITVVAEMMGGISPAAEYMEAALKAGKHVVSSNKAALAAKLPTLTKAASDAGKLLLYEASVCGAIPIMHTIQNSLAANGFESIEGIVNGTSNYILTKMSDENLSYEAALKQAQEKGFAEADPTADVEGIDSANKLTILAANAFGIYVDPMKIDRVGITGVTKADLDSAKSKGCKIKLIASAVKKEDGAIEVSVAPRELPLSNPLSMVDNEFNAVRVVGNMCDEIFLKGRGAGSLPTGSAVAGDILEAAVFEAGHN